METASAETNYNHENRAAELVDFLDKNIDPDYVPENNQRPKKIRGIKKKCISKATSAVLDRTNISHRKAAMIINTFLVNANANPKSFSTSASTLYRHRKLLRETHFNVSKENFVNQENLVVHLDGKKLPIIDGSNEKEERIAVTVTGKDKEKLLAVPALNESSAENIAAIVNETVLEWNLTNSVVGLSFDTASVNTGKKNGTCIRLQRKLKKKLLWLACRHHTSEIICSDVYKTLFSNTPSSAPYPELFKTFKQAWKHLDKKNIKKCDDKSLNCKKLKAKKKEVIDFILKYLNSKHKNKIRADYLELLELTLIYFGVTPPNGIKLKAPGAFSNARWMSKAIYVLKIYLFRHQFEISPQTLKACKTFCSFLCLYYVKYWITCPLSCDAAINDLTFIQEITDFKLISTKTVVTAIKALKRHLWYLGEELIVLGLFSDNVSNETKNLMQQKLLSLKAQNKLTPLHLQSIKKVIKNSTVLAQKPYPRKN